MKLDELYRISHSFRQLAKIARKLHLLDEHACNGTIDDQAYKRRTGKLMAEANELADIISTEFNAYHQSDPRGCSLYLITKDLNNSNYSNGVAIY